MPADIEASSARVMSLPDRWGAEFVISFMLLLARSNIFLTPASPTLVLANAVPLVNALVF